MSSENCEGGVDITKTAQWQEQLDKKFSNPAFLSYLRNKYDEACEKRKEPPTDEGFADYVNQERQRTHRDCIGAILWSDERARLFDLLQHLEQDANLKERLVNQILGDRTIVDWLDDASNKYWNNDRYDWHGTCEPEDVQARTFEKLRKAFCEGRYQYCGELELKGYIYKTASYATKELYKKHVLGPVISMADRSIRDVRDNAESISTLHDWYCDFLGDLYQLFEDNLYQLLEDNSVQLSGNIRITKETRDIWCITDVNNGLKYAVREDKDKLDIYTGNLPKPTNIAEYKEKAEKLFKRLPSIAEYKRKAEELLKHLQGNPVISSELREDYNAFCRAQTDYSTPFDEHLKGFVYFVVDYMFRKAWEIFEPPPPPPPSRKPLTGQAAIIVKGCLSQTNVFRAYAFLQVHVDGQKPKQVAEQLLTFRENCLTKAEKAGGQAIADKIMTVIDTRQDDPRLYEQYPLTVVLRTISKASRPTGPEDNAILRPLVARATSSIKNCIADQIDARWTDEEECIDDWFDMYNAVVIFEDAPLETLFVDLANEGDTAKELLWRIHAILANSYYTDDRNFLDTARKQLQLQGEFSIIKYGNIEWFIEGTAEMAQHPHKVIVQVLKKREIAN